MIPPEGVWEAWLDPAHPDPVPLRALMQPYAAGTMERYPVGAAAD